MTYCTNAPYSSSRLKFTELTDYERETLFFLTPILNHVYDCIRQTNSEPWNTQESIFLHANSNKRAEWLFAGKLLASYGSSIPQIIHLLNSTPPTLQTEELTEKRNEMINRLAGTTAGQHWMKCMKTEDGWNYMARFVYGAESKLTPEEVDKFFLTLDQIAIMHDLIKGRGLKYGLNYNPKKELNVENFKQYCVDPKKARTILELLHKHIDQKDTPKRSSRPVRAAMTAGVIMRPPYDWFDEEFGALCKNNKSSYNDYTKEDSNSYAYDDLFDEMVDDFRRIK